MADDLQRKRGAQSIRGSGVMSRPPRFYDNVSVEPAAHGFQVCLDGKPLITPLDAPLIVPTHRLGDAIAGEWAGQGERIEPASLALTRLANTAVERAAGTLRDEMLDEIASFAGFDLVCFRAVKPQGLVERQKQHWNPVVTWADDFFGVSFLVSEILLGEAQPDRVTAAVRAKVAALPSFALIGCHDTVRLTGSTLIAVRLLENACDADTAWTAAHVDEDWQVDQWGEDVDAAKRRAGRRAAFDTAVLFASLACPVH